MDEEEKAAPPWGRIAAGVGALVAVIVAVAVVVAVATRDTEPAEPTAAPPVPASTKRAATATTSPAELSCPAKREGNLTIGNGPGSTANGADAILGFQHSFYTDRSGVKARTFVAPDAANVSQAEVIQNAINDVIPVGTSYCVRIVEVTPELFDADLTEHRPDGTTTVYKQRITTVNRDGKSLIFTIDER